MATTQQMAEFLLHHDPPKHPVRLAFYNYLKNCWPVDKNLTSDVIQDFWLRSLAAVAQADSAIVPDTESGSLALEPQYWQAYKEQLTDQTVQDLELFLRSRDEIGPHLEFDPKKLQVLMVKEISDFKLIIENDLEPQKERGDQIRYVQRGLDGILAVWLKHRGGLRILAYRPMAFIDGYTLRPLAPVTDLRYDLNLELSRFDRQLLEGPMMTSFYFQVEDNQIFGVRFQQSNFQKIEAFEIEHLTQKVDLFYQLKRLEQNYIRPESDPFYQELISLLEKSYQLISQGEPGARKLAEAALSKGRLAMKNIFPEDRYLLSLITNIEYWLVKSEQKTNKDKNEQKSSHQSI